jgi:hypothetical protein
MKQKSAVRVLILAIVLLLGFSLIPVQFTTAQPEDDPDFVVTLALMAVADDRLDGVMDLSALSNLRAVVDDYYNQKSFLRMDTDTAAALNHQKQVVLSSLDKKINHQQTQSYRAQVGFFIAMTDAINPVYQQGPEFFGDPYSTFIRALSSNYEPDPEAVVMLQARLSAGTQVTLQQDLDGHVASGVPDGKALVGQSSTTVYDFDAGEGEGQGGSLTVQPRPLNFTNTGGKTVFVSVEYYQPPKGLAVASPTMNVEVAAGASVVMTGFPQGNYVFCVDWQTDLDTNGDGLKDYDRAVVRGWLSGSHPADPQEAQVVQVGASFSETPTGRCGGFLGEAPSREQAMAEAGMTEDDPGYVAAEPPKDEPVEPTGADPVDPTDDDWDGEDKNPGADFWDQDDDNGDDDPSGNSLTTAEQANQGGHAYQVVCWEEGSGMSDTMHEYMAISFSESGVTIDGVYGSRFYSRTSGNVYANSDGSRIIFSSSGFSSKIWLSTETSGEGVEKINYRHCTSVLND